MSAFLGILGFLLALCVFIVLSSHLGSIVGIILFLAVLGLSVWLIIGMHRRVLPASSEDLKAVYGMSSFLLFLIAVFTWGMSVENKKREEKGELVIQNSPTCGSMVAPEGEIHRIRRFCDRFLSEGGVIGAYSLDMILVIKASDELAYGFLGNRLLSERILRRWLDGWEGISGYESGHIIVKLDGIDLITVKHGPFSRDKVVEFHR